MRIIGVTGPSGSGKTLLGEYFAGLGIPTLDADKIYHSMLVPPSECLTAIRSVFGDAVFKPDGTLDRAALGEIVFGAPSKLELLNETVLGRVIDEIKKQVARLEALGHTTVIVDAPTLIESGFNKACDMVISVLSSPSTRQERIARRDGISEQRARERIAAQKSDGFYSSASDIVLYNDGNRDDFFKLLDSVAERILTDAKGDTQ